MSSTQQAVVGDFSGVNETREEEPWEGWCTFSVMGLLSLHPQRTIPAGSRVCSGVALLRLAPRGPWPRWSCPHCADRLWVVAALPAGLQNAVSCC